MEIINKSPLRHYSFKKRFVLITFMDNCTGKEGDVLIRQRKITYKSIFFKSNIIKTIDKVMRSVFILVFGFIIFFSIDYCGNKETIKSPIIGLKATNKAEYYYGGYKTTIIHNKEDLNFIERKLKRLQGDVSDSIQVNVNYGFVEVSLLHQNKDLSAYFDIVFTQSHGDIIIYGVGHYYYDQELVDFIKKKLQMANRSFDKHK